MRDAPLQGFVKHAGGGGNHVFAPRTHPRGKYVTEGVAVEFAYPEHFDVRRISQVWLEAVRVGPDSSLGSHLLLCQFCAHHERKLGKVT